MFLQKNFIDLIKCLKGQLIVFCKKYFHYSPKKNEFFLIQTKK